MTKRCWRRWHRLHVFVGAWWTWTPWTWPCMWSCSASHEDLHNLRLDPFQIRGLWRSTFCIHRFVGSSLVLGSRIIWSLWTWRRSRFFGSTSCCLNDWEELFSGGVRCLSQPCFDTWSHLELGRILVYRSRRGWWHRGSSRTGWWRIERSQHCGNCCRSLPFLSPEQHWWSFQLGLG